MFYLSYSCEKIKQKLQQNNEYSEMTLAKSTRKLNYLEKMTKLKHHINNIDERLRAYHRDLIRMHLGKISQLAEELL